MLKVKFVVMNFKQQNSLQIFAVIDEFCKNMNVQMLRKKLSLCIFDYYYYGKNKILQVFNVQACLFTNENSTMYKPKINQKSQLF